MLNIDIIIFTVALVFFLNFFLNKNKILLDSPTAESHKGHASKYKVPISLGIVLIILSTYLIIKNYYYINLFVVLVFLVGLISDIRYLHSPGKRIILQSLIIFLYLLFSNNLIYDIRIMAINELLNYKLFAIFFTLFCITILINGTNFTDGLNTLAIGYYLIVLLSITLVCNILGLQSENKFIYIFNYVQILFIFFIFNALGKSFLGDGGSYALSFIVGIYLIDLSSFNYQISPWFVALLLWYPAFENLFSIIRRQRYSFKLAKADTLHLHHLFFLFIKRKTKYSHLGASFLTSILINAFNFITILTGSFFYNDTETLVLVVSFNIFIYIYTYIFLTNYFKKMKRVN